MFPLSHYSISDPMILLIYTKFFSHGPLRFGLPERWGSAYAGETDKGPLLSLCFLPEVAPSSLFQEHGLRGGEARSRFEFVSRLREARLDRPHGGKDVAPADDPHMADAEVLLPDLCVEPPREDDACLRDQGKDGTGHAVGEVRGGQGVGRLIGADRDLFQS